jgi:hypothetical protein
MRVQLWVGVDEGSGTCGMEAIVTVCEDSAVFLLEGG